MHFFVVHFGAGEWRPEVGRNIVERYAESSGGQQSVREPARRCLDALWSFLAGVNKSAHAPEGAR